MSTAYISSFVYRFNWGSIILSLFVALLPLIPVYHYRIYCTKYHVHYYHEPY